MGPAETTKGYLSWMDHRYRPFREKGRSEAPGTVSATPARQKPATTLHAGHRHARAAINLFGSSGSGSSIDSEGFS
jgi:hypothetical protein